MSDIGGTGRITPLRPSVTLPTKINRNDEVFRKSLSFENIFSSKFESLVIEQIGRRSNINSNNNRNNNNNHSSDSSGWNNNYSSDSLGNVTSIVGKKCYSLDNHSYGTNDGSNKYLSQQQHPDNLSENMDQLKHDINDNEQEDNEAPCTSLPFIGPTSEVFHTDQQVDVYSNKKVESWLQNNFKGENFNRRCQSCDVLEGNSENHNGDMLEDDGLGATGYHSLIAQQKPLITGRLLEKRYPSSNVLDENKSKQTFQKTSVGSLLRRNKNAVTSERAYSLPSQSPRAARKSQSTISVKRSDRINKLSLPALNVGRNNIR